MIRFFRNKYARGVALGVYLPKWVDFFLSVDPHPTSENQYNEYKARRILPHLYTFQFPRVKFINRNVPVMRRIYDYGWIWQKPKYRGSFWETFYEKEEIFSTVLRKCLFIGTIAAITSDPVPGRPNGGS